MADVTQEQVVDYIKGISVLELSQLVKTLEVAKIRGAQQTTGNILTFDVEPEIGMKIMPVSRARA